MNNLLTHKGFKGSVEFDSDDEILHGKILFISDTICYDAPSAKEIKKAFEDAVDAYIEFCADIGKSPNKPCSGTFNVRITPELHQEACLYALEKRISLNTLVQQSIHYYVCTQHIQSTQQLASSVNDLGQRIGQMTQHVMRFSASTQLMEAQTAWTVSAPNRHS